MNFSICIVLVMGIFSVFHCSLFAQTDLVQAKRDLCEGVIPYSGSEREAEKHLLNREKLNQKIARFAVRRAFESRQKLSRFVGARSNQDGMPVSCSRVQFTEREWTDLTGIPPESGDFGFGEKEAVEVIQASVKTAFLQQLTHRASNIKTSKSILRGLTSKEDISNKAEHKKRERQIKNRTLLARKFVLGWMQKTMEKHRVQHPIIQAPINKNPFDSTTVATYLVKAVEARQPDFSVAKMIDSLIERAMTEMQTIGAIPEVHRNVFMENGIPIKELQEMTTLPIAILTVVQEDVDAYALAVAKRYIQEVGVDSILWDKVSEAAINMIEAVGRTVTGVCKQGPGVLEIDVRFYTGYMDSREKSEKTDADERAFCFAGWGSDRRQKIESAAGVLGYATWFAGATIAPPMLLVSGVSQMVRAVSSIEREIKKLDIQTNLLPTSETEKNLQKIQIGSQALLIPAAFASIGAGDWIRSGKWAQSAKWVQQGGTNNFEKGLKFFWPGKIDPVTGKLGWGLDAKIEFIQGNLMTSAIFYQTLKNSGSDPWKEPSFYIDSLGNLIAYAAFSKVIDGAGGLKRFTRELPFVIGAFWIANDMTKVLSGLISPDQITDNRSREFFVKWAGSYTLINLYISRLRTLAINAAVQGAPGFARKRLGFLGQAYRPVVRGIEKISKSKRVQFWSKTGTSAIQYYIYSSWLYASFTNFIEDRKIGFVENSKKFFKPEVMDFFYSIEQEKPEPDPYLKELEQWMREAAVDP